MVNEKQLGYWVGLMKDQDMLKTSIDVAKLIAK
jgi:NitT/TauT family transport system substrate-binding protein